MKKIDIDNFKFSINNNEFLYLVEVKNDNYILKRIKIKSKNKSLDIINITNGFLYINNYLYLNKEKIENKLNYFEKVKIINDIINNISKSDIVKDLLNIDKLLNYINDNYMDYIISNGVIALTLNNKNKDTLNIILLETNNILGSINLDINKINIDEYFYKDSLYLYKNYLKLFKNEEKILKLK